MEECTFFSYLNPLKDSAYRYFSVSRWCADHRGSFATDPRSAISRGAHGNTETNDSVVDGLLSARLQNIHIERSRAGVDPAQL